MMLVFILPFAAAVLDGDDGQFMPVAGTTEGDGHDRLAVVVTF